METYQNFTFLCQYQVREYKDGKFKVPNVKEVFKLRSHKECRPVKENISYCEEMIFESLGNNTRFVFKHVLYICEPKTAKIAKELKEALNSNAYGLQIMETELKNRNQQNQQQNQNQNQ